MHHKQRQMDPSALTLAVAYRPIPLLSANYSFKLGKGGKHDHQIQLNLTYRLGLQLAQQFDSYRVASERSLPARPLALVQRNQQIVLNHKFNDLIQMQLSPSKIRGRPGCSITFAVNITTPRPLKEWQLSWGGDLLAAGGTITANADWTQATVTLPLVPRSYSLQLNTSNTRGVSARSNVMEVEVETLQPNPSGPDIPIAPVQQVISGGSDNLEGSNEKIP